MANTTIGGIATSSTAAADADLREIEQGGVSKKEANSVLKAYMALELVNAQTGTSYTYVTGDGVNMVTHSNASSIAGTLPQAGASFPNGWKLAVKNIGAGTLTITPTTSTINGASSIVLTTGQGVTIVSDGTNYVTKTMAAAGTFTGGTLSSALNEAPSVTLASASTVNIGAAAANTINITGAVTITAFDTIADGARRTLIFGGASMLTHNSTSLILPTGANITPAVGDVAQFVSKGSGNWKCVEYMKADGTALAGSGGSTNPPAINNQIGTSYTLALTDAPSTSANQGIVTMSNAAASTLTVPPNSSVAFPVGTVIQIPVLGAGQLTVAQGSGVTIRTASSYTSRAQYATLGLTKIATDTWMLYGDLT